MAQASLHRSIYPESICLSLCLISLSASEGFSLGAAPSLSLVCLSLSPRVSNCLSEPLSPSFVPFHTPRADVSWYKGLGRRVALSPGPQEGGRPASGLTPPPDAGVPGPPGELAHRGAVTGQNKRMMPLVPCTRNKRERDRELGVPFLAEWPRMLSQAR